MSKFGGLVAGALGGLGEAAQTQARGYIAEERELSVRDQLSKIEEARQMRIMQASERLRREGRGADIDQDIATAPRKAEAAAATERTVGTARNEVAAEGERQVGPVRATNAGLVTTAQGEAERGNAAALAKDPAALAGIRAKAQAGHIESAGSLAQAELARLQVQERKDYGMLVDQIANIEGDASLTDEQKKAKLKPLISKRDSIVLKARGPGAAARDPELDTVEVIEEREDPATGDKIRTKRVEKRRPGNGTPKPQPDKVATMDEVSRYAAARGISAEKARVGLEAQGYKIQ